MGVSAEDIVQLSILETSKVKAGKQLLKETFVEWISVIELPVENFVRKNEFVLTTGMGCENDPQLLEEYVEDVVQSGASILGVATGRYVYDIPDRVIQVANKNDLILIDIPWEIRFGDILQHVMEKITLDKQEERQQAEKVRQKLIDCVLQDKDLQQISHTLYRFIRMPVLMVDQSGFIRANQHMNKQVLRVYQDENSQHNLQPNSSIDLHFKEHPLYYHLEAYDLDDKIIFQLPIINNHKTQGYLIVQPKSKEQLSWFVMNVLEHALTACALYFVKENAIELTEIRLKDNFVLNLAKQETPIDDQLLSKAKLLGYDLNYPYVCLLGEVSNREDLVRDKNDSPENSSLQSLNYYIQKEITYAGKLLGRHTMATFDEGQVIIFLEADHHPYMETANHFLDTISRRLNELLAGMELSWGISTPKDNETAFYETYQEAKTALDIGVQQGDRGERTFFSNTKINRLLMAISKESEIASIVKETLQPLLDYDKKRQTDLLYTFMTYNKYKGNVSQTARALNLHRQSLLHRLRNIEALTQLSLIDSDDSFLLELSVRLWTLKKIK
ncbi:PucR family transcriptional regulator [Aquibacillus albus]|uniref:Purine catabolism regulator n=1 Tax=Aquibacillus albus TaxID=1168171 RepID=A0ABS2N3B9_9BACI|nr:PucR family transcriptional regulator [Aquibacillus albus]MBM7572596.1 purine catabolism regulator [Aquibacillus albus]